ncbi:MAG: hypothetical protein LBL90_05735 [Prevotellaceae bacterium]|nr:hypothetical protein [Prevotellaceae bacterium]
MRGRKRHIITDTNGLLLTIEIHAAKENDGKADFRAIKSRGGLEENVENDFRRTWKSPCVQTNQPGLSPCPNAGSRSGHFHV